MKNLTTVLIIFIMTVLLSCANVEPVSNTGVERASADIEVGIDGMTTEQSNVKARLEMDNDPGAVKYLYVTSAFTGNLVMFSTVQGKVTSSGKRLSPYSVSASGEGGVSYGIRIDIDGNAYRTAEVLQDDGTYGSSIPYLYWWDVNGTYRQIYPNGGIMIQISDQPLNIPTEMMEFVINDD